MNTIRLFQLIAFNVLFFKQIENVLITKDNILNTCLMVYSRKYNWQKQIPDFTSIILNEQLVHALNNNKDLTDVQGLYNEVISKMYDQVPPHTLVQQLWKIYQKYDVQSFITMTRAQLALYWRYRLDKTQNPYYLLLVAHCLYKIKNDAFFYRLNESTQQLVHNAIGNVPTSLQYLFGEAEFCLHNVQNSETIFQATDKKINNSTSQVLSSVLNGTEYKNLLIQSLFEETEEDNLSDLYLALVSKHFHGYFHRLPEYDNVIGTNDTERRLDNFIWSVQLVDNNQLVFEQDEYLMCRNGSYIYCVKDRTIFDRECQWSAGDCISGK